MLLIIVLLSIALFFALIWLAALLVQARSDDKAFWKIATLAMDMNNANKDALDNCHDIISTNKKLLEEQHKTLAFNKQLTACVNAMARELDKNHIAFDVEKYFPDITDPEGRELEDRDDERMWGDPSDPNTYDDEDEDEQVQETFDPNDLYEGDDMGED